MVEHNTKFLHISTHTGIIRKHESKTILHKTQSTTHGINNIKLVNSQQAREVYLYKNIKTFT
jgi:hypothetical protein